MFVLEDAEEIELGCSFGDLLCKGAEDMARGVGSFVGWLAEVVLGSQDLAPGTTLWDSAIDEASNWFAIAILVMLATAMIGVATGLLSFKPRRVWWTMGGLAAAIPSTYIALGLGGELLSISDELSDLALKRIGGEDGFQNVFRAAIQGGTGSDVGGVAVQIMSGGTATAVPMILMLLGLVIGLILMSFALAFRNLGLMILIAFAPLAFMAVPMKGGWSIAKKWALAGIALLLSKPLMFGVLAMLLKSADGMALFSPQTLTVMAGLFVVSFMPMMAYSFFSFLGSGNENMAGQNVASPAAQKVTQPGNQLTGAVVQQGVTKTFGTTKNSGSSKPAPSSSSGGGSGSKPTKPDQPSKPEQPSSQPSGGNSGSGSGTGGGSAGGGSGSTGGGKPNPGRPNSPGGGAGSPSVPEVPKPSAGSGGGRPSKPAPPASRPRW